jgi:propanol-preferring alcohol dehydrogenase
MQTRDSVLARGVGAGTDHRIMRVQEYRAPQPGLFAAERPVPEPEPSQVLVRVRACAVCRTDLHLVDGALPASTLHEPRRPVVPGHEIVGHIERLGAGVHGFRVGQRVGIPWLGWACGECRYCRGGRENLCADARYTGYTVDGGFADYALADARFCLPIPERYGDAEAAPLLCAGLIGYRAYRMAGDAQRLALYGFGAAGHILCQVAVAQGRTVYAYTRPGDRTAQEHALALGAAWAGDAGSAPPQPFDAALVFAPVGALVTEALGHLERGGSVICAGIHMSDVPGFPYARLWGERSIRSVANLTRADGEAFMKLAADVPIRCAVRTYGLADAQTALDDLRAGRVQGAAVLVP